MNKNFILKRSIAYAIAVFLAIIVAHYYAMTEKCWLPITALLVMQTPIGLALRQGVIRFFWILFSLIVISGCMAGLQAHGTVLFSSAALVLSLCCYLTVKNSANEKVLLLPFVFAVLLGVMLLLPVTPLNFMYSRLYDVTLGAALGLLVNLVILPARADVEFRKNVIPVLTAYGDYFAAIMNLLFRREHALSAAQQEKMDVEKTLQATAAFFPVWVYESGLSIALRQGHRHFLIMIERVGQILFSLHHIARHEFDPILMADLQPALTAFLCQAEKIFIALTIVLNLGHLSEGVSDLSEEMLQLETAFNNTIPVSLELIDMSEDYILCAALVADLKDMRMALIRLGQALRSAVRV